MSVELQNYHLYSKKVQKWVHQITDLSLLPLLSKVFKRVVLDQTIAFLSPNEIIHEYQSGFRSKHSPEVFFRNLEHVIMLMIYQG